VTVICRYIFLRLWDFVHFAVIKICDFEYTMYTMSLYRIAMIIDNIILGLQASNNEKANQYKFVQRGLLVVSSKRPPIPAFFQPK